MIYLDDNITRHPKLMKAATKVGGANALALFVEGLAYARQHLTDGYIPTIAIVASPLVRKPIAVADALVAVKLWHRVPDGYRIHDFHDWNKSAADVKGQREKWRAKKRRQRHGDNGNFARDISFESRGLSRRDARRDSVARGTTIHVPHVLGTSRHDREIRNACTASVLTGAKNRAPEFSREVNNGSRRSMAAIVRDCSRHDRTRSRDDRFGMDRRNQAATGTTQFRVATPARTHERDSRRRTRVVETLGSSTGADCAAARAEIMRPVAAHTRRGDRGVAVVARSRIDHNNQTDPARTPANDARHPRDRATTRVASRVRGDHRAIHPMRRGRIERAA